MNSKEIQYVKYIVYRYLKGKPELQDFKEDLEQEGYLELLKAKADYEPAKATVDINLYVYYRVKQVLQNYIRSEAKHFRKPPADHESPYWDLPDYIDVEELEVYDDPDDLRDLVSILEQLDLTENQKEVIEAYLMTGSYTGAANRLSISRQRVHRLIQIVIKKAIALVDKQVA